MTRELELWAATSVALQNSGSPSLIEQWRQLSTSDQWLIVIAGLLALVVLFVTVIEPNRLQRNEVVVRIPKLPPAFEGFRITVLTDVHHLPSVTPKLARAVRMTNASAPDLIVLLGDFAASWPHRRGLSRTSYRFALRRIGPLVSALRAPNGVLAVLGNHDYYADAKLVTQWLRECGVQPLINEHVRIVRGEHELIVAGLDDLWEGTLDADSGCRDAPDSAPTVVLSHNPDGVLHLSPRRHFDLMLSGHTHGGQVVLPWIGALVRHARVCGPHTTSGFVPNDHATLFVSRGVGEQIPLRFGCTPEVVTVVLKSN